MLETHPSNTCIEKIHRIHSTKYSHNFQVILMPSPPPFRLLIVLCTGLFANNDSVKSLRNMVHIVLSH